VETARDFDISDAAFDDPAAARLREED